MNSDQLQGKWHQVKGTVKTQFGRLTDDDITQISGQYEKLLGKVQERYGIAREEAETRVNQWMKSTHDEPAGAARTGKANG